MASKSRRLSALTNSKGSIESDLCFEIINRIILDDGHAELEREGGTVIQLATDPRIEGKKEPSALAGDRVAEIHPNIGTWIE